MNSEFEYLEGKVKDLGFDKTLSFAHEQFYFTRNANEHLDSKTFQLTSMLIVFLGLISSSSGFLIANGRFGNIYWSEATLLLLCFLLASINVFIAFYYTIEQIKPESYFFPNIEKYAKDALQYDNEYAVKKIIVELNKLMNKSMKPINEKKSENVLKVTKYTLSAIIYSVLFLPYLAVSFQTNPKELIFQLAFDLPFVGLLIITTIILCWKMNMFKEDKKEQDPLKAQEVTISEEE